MGADPVVPLRSLTLERQKSGDTVTLLCHGRLVAETAGRLQDEVHALLPQAQTIVLDLSDVQYMDSSGLGALVSVYVSTKRAGKRLQLLKVSERVQELLKITKLLSVFEGYGEYL
ncbi:MAG: STAS domain-containing protein [Candidatus Korobacteraceae bacterium]